MDFQNKTIQLDMSEIYKRNYNWEEFDNTKILITGAYGMLASYLVFFFAYLNTEFHYNIEIYAQGRNIAKAKEKFSSIWNEKWFQFITNDISMPIINLPNFQYIIHAAGIANPRFYSTNPVNVTEPNILGTYFLLKKIISTSCKGFLFFSSGEVYGQLDNSCTLDEQTFGHMDPLKLHSCYGESKRMAETLCKSFWEQYKIPTKIARISHTYGPTMDIKNDPRVFASFMRCVIEKRDIEILSDGTAILPFTYISDATAAFLLLLLKGKCGEAYNVCNSHETLSINQLADIMVQINPHLNVIHKTRELDDHYLESNKQPYIIVNTKKLNDLGWEAIVDTFIGMQKTYNSLMEYY